MLISIGKQICLEKIQQLLMNLVKDDNKLEIIKNVIDLIKYIYQKKSYK